MTTSGSCPWKVGHVGAKARLHGFLEDSAKSLDVFGVATCRLRHIVTGIVDVPILMHAVRFPRGAKEVTGRHSIYAIEQCALTWQHESAGVHGLRTPARRYAHRDERFYLGREIECAVVLRVEKRLHAKPVASRDHPLIALVPHDECVLAPKVMQAFGAVVFVQV